jgi:Mg/Co/Ni transporter MgtE
MAANANDALEENTLPAIGHDVRKPFPIPEKPERPMVSETASMKDSTEREEGRAGIELSMNGISLEKSRRDLEAGIFAETRRRILELALLLEKGEVTEKVIADTQESLQKIAMEIEKQRGKDVAFNYPLLDTVGRIVFEDLPLVFGKDARVESALNVLQRVFRQRYNAVVVVDVSRKALGIVPSAVLINSDPEEILGKIPTVTQNFSVTLESKPDEVTAIMDRLGVNVLPVVDGKGTVIGTFTSRDHVKGVAALYSKQLMETLKTHGMLADIQKDLKNPLS